MITVNVNQLADAALDWAVQKCSTSEWKPYIKPSSDWAQGGPIIEREGIAVVAESPEMWCAWRALEGYLSEENSVYGDTPLIAAMRCYVASKLGDEVEVPDELMESV